MIRADKENNSSYPETLDRDKECSISPCFRQYDAKMDRVNNYQECLAEANVLGTFHLVTQLVTS